MNLGYLITIKINQISDTYLGSEETVCCLTLSSLQLQYATIVLGTVNLQQADTRIDLKSCEYKMKKNLFHIPIT